VGTENVEPDRETDRGTQVATGNTTAETVGRPTVTTVGVRQRGSSY